MVCGKKVKHRGLRKKKLEIRTIHSIYYEGLCFASFFSFRISLQFTPYAVPSVARSFCTCEYLLKQQAFASSCSSTCRAYGFPSCCPKSATFIMSFTCPKRSNGFMVTAVSRWTLLRFWDGHSLSDCLVALCSHHEPSHPVRLSLHPLSLPWRSGSYLTLALRSVYNGPSLLCPYPAHLLKPTLFHFLQLLITGLFALFFL